MSKKIAFLFPGQGAQYPGMGRDFFDHFDEAKALFQEADKLLGVEFSKLIFDGPAEELTLTKNSQLAIFITSVAILRVIQSKFPEIVPTVCAGLSLGEYTALVAAGKISFNEGLQLVKARGSFMQEACITHPGSMQVVLGLDLSSVEEVIHPIEGVWIANLNCPGQIVIAGTIEGLEKAAPLLKKQGAKRVLPLDVSGAFHSGLMQEAQDKLKPLIDEVEMSSSNVQLVTNTLGDIPNSDEAMKQAMISQVTHPVLWQKGIEKMVSMEIDLFIEMGPGKTLAGMHKRIGVKAPILSIEKIEDLEGVGQYDPITQR